MTRQEEFIYNQVLNGCIKESIGTLSSKSAATAAS